MVSKRIHPLTEGSGQDEDVRALYLCQLVKTGSALCGLALAIMVSKENPHPFTGGRGQGENISVISIGLCVCVS
jgi:hypothetical protein